MSATQTPFPLEEYFSKVANQKQDRFPGNTNYWDHYWSMLTVLRDQFYKHINVGLAVHSGSIAGIYTDHSGEHFDEVIKYAGRLVGIDGDEENTFLSPYEVYLLLMGIRLHDVGNIFGRSGHEKMALDVYKSSTAIASRDKFETKVITRIAQCHGGVTPSGSKDTISQLKELDHLGQNIGFRPRMVAALVRFADEVCEHRGRVSQHLIDSGQIPEQNLLFHLYAAAIKASIVNRREKSVAIEYVLHKKHLESPYIYKSDPNEPEYKYLLDEVLDRLGKLNLERIYCNQFLDPPLQITRVKASITIVDGVDDETQLSECHIEIKPEGYPQDDCSWRTQATGFAGEEMKNKLFSNGGPA